MGHAKMWTQIYPVFPLRGGPYHVTNYLVLWEEVVMAWLWPVDCLLDNSLHPLPRCSPASRRTEHSWAAALTFKLLLVTKIHPWPTFSTLGKSFEQVKEISHLGRQLPSVQVKWSGGQVGSGQADSSLKDFIVDNGGNDGEGEAPSILAVDCAVAPQRARYAALVTNPLIWIQRHLDRGFLS